MALLAVQQPGTTVTVRGEAVELVRNGTVVLVRPLHEVDELHLYGAVSLDTTALRALLAKQVTTLILTPSGNFLGSLNPPEPAAAERRQAQYRRLTDRSVAIELAQTVVRTKILNQRAVLVRGRREYPARGRPTAITAMRALAARATTATDLDRLRGIEGLAARLYFEGLAQLIRTGGFEFTRRSRRPPEDPFNACLSFGYTLLLRRVEQAILRCGLDPSFGALHEPFRGRPSLALDLMEPLRPLVIDRLILRLVNRRQLDANDFVNPDCDEGAIGQPPGNVEPRRRAVHMGPTARAVFLRALFRSLRAPVRYEQRGARFPLSSIIEMQAVELARWLEGAAPKFEPLAAE